ncbi:MAG: flippase [Candidatus Dormibacteraceae bacterium]
MASAAIRLAGRAVRNSTLVLAANVVSRLVALVMVVVLARHLGPTQYGRYTTMVAYSAIISVLTDLGLDTLYTREAARDMARQPTYLGTTLLGQVPLAVVAVAVFGVALDTADLRDLILPGALLLVLATYSQLLRNTFYAAGRLGFEVVAILAQILIQAVGIIGGARLGFGTGFFVGVYAASYAFVAVYCLVVIPLFKVGGLRLVFDWPLLRRWLRLAFPFALGSLLTNVYFKADVPILQHFKPYAEVGWFTFAYKPFEALQFVPLAIQSVVYPVLAVAHQSTQEKMPLYYGRLLKALCLLGWPVTVGTFMLVEPIGGLFHLYPQSIPALRILAFGIVFLFVNSAFTAMLYAIDRQGWFAWVTAIACVLNIGLNLLLIPSFGYLAAAATTVITEAAFSIAGYLFVARRYRVPWVRLTWRIGVAGVVMAAALYPLRDHSILLGVPVGGLVYVAVLLLLRAVDRTELRALWQGLRARAAA